MTFHNQTEHHEGTFEIFINEDFLGTATEIRVGMATPNDPKESTDTYSEAAYAEMLAQSPKGVPPNRHERRKQAAIARGLKRKPHQLVHVKKMLERLKVTL